VTSSLGQVKPKTIKLVTQQKGERAQIGWFKIRTVVSVCLDYTNPNNRVGLVHIGSHHHQQQQQHHQRRHHHHHQRHRFIEV
jgi:hypothetical protein